MTFRIRQSKRWFNFSGIPRNAGEFCNKRIIYCFELKTCRAKFLNQKSCCPKQVVFRKAVVYKCKPVDYSNLVVYKCKPVVYKCKLVDYSKAVVYKCKLAVYTCKILNSRFTTVLLISLLDTVEVTPFFQFLFCKAVVYRCKLLLYYKPPLYKL